MRKFALTAVVLGLVLGPGAAAEKRTYVSLMAGAHSVLQYGSVDEYEAGENDFPVTPAHAALSAGFTFGRLFAERLGLEVDARYAHSSRITLEDPSDGDTVGVETMKHVSLTGNFLVFLGQGKFKPYLVVGAGGDRVVEATEQTATSSLGYEVTLIPPEKKFDLVADGGVGILYDLSPSFALRLEARYVLIPKTAGHPTLHSFSLAGGGLIRLF